MTEGLEAAEEIYVEADFILALIKDQDWLQESAEEIYETHRESLFTHRDTLLELLLLAYREEWNAERIIVNTKALLEVRGDAESILAAASHVAENGFTPLDALHLVHAADRPLVSSDESYDGHADWVRLEDTRDS